MPTVENCRNCDQPTPKRVGRGLCRPCWDRPEIREKFPPIAPFGGPDAAKVFLASIGHQPKPPRPPAKLKTRPKTYKVVPVDDEFGDPCWLVAEVVFERLSANQRSSFLVPTMVFYREATAERYVRELAEGLGIDV